MTKISAQMILVQLIQKKITYLFIYLFQTQYKTAN